MMKLLVDMGNSALKWATISDGILSQVSSSGYEDELQRLKTEWQLLAKPESIIVSCVAQEQQWHELFRLTETLWQISPERIITPAEGCGVVNGYQFWSTHGFK